MTIQQKSGQDLVIGGLEWGTGQLVCVCVCACVRQREQSVGFLVSSLLTGQTAGYKLKESRVGWAGSLRKVRTSISAFWIWSDLWILTCVSDPSDELGGWRGKNSVKPSKPHGQRSQSWVKERESRWRELFWVSLVHFCLFALLVQGTHWGTRKILGLLFY